MRLAFCLLFPAVCWILLALAHYTLGDGHPAWWAFAGYMIGVATGVIICAVVMAKEVDR